MHVHSTFSDGRDRIEDNIAEAEALGLTALGCVDHVRVDTDWVPDYVAAVQRLRGETAVELRCGIEAKLLDTTGALDLPAADRRRGRDLRRRPPGAAGRGADPSARGARADRRRRPERRGGDRRDPDLDGSAPSIAPSTS